MPIETVVERLRTRIVALLSNRTAKNGRERADYASAAEVSAAHKVNEAAFKLLPDVLEVFETDRLIIDTLEADRQSLSDRIDVLSKHVWALEQAEARYRYAHDVLGAGDPKTGRAWDLLHRAGDSARASLTQGGKTSG